MFVALRPIVGLDDGYFYAARAIDPMSDKVARDASQVSAVFANFESHRHNIELGFAAVFVMLSLTMLISAVWMGLTFANQLVGPIRRLIRATDEVASGNLYVQVPTRRSEGDLGHLGETFNKMTIELRQQRNRLTAANALNDERRAFIEAVLSGVPACVIGVDVRGVITVSNAAADKLLCGDDPRGLVGRDIGDVFPQVAEIVAQARAMGLRSHQSQATWSHQGRERLLNVRVTGDPQRGDQSAVVTLDDISELVAAQRSAAWADVARRIAHEIKNPLTPIQLSAERLKRRYGRHIVEGKEIFDQCIDTIIRQVDDIKRMVDEFSSFTRMPKARPSEDDLSDCVRQALFLMRVGRQDIDFIDDLPSSPVIADFDRRLISQALTNVLKNAGEGIDALGAREEKGRIVVSLRVDGDLARIAVSDNGKGFPNEDRRKLIEPYVTTRAEGTGLGLPIVIKIFEDHHGEVELVDGLQRADGGFGALVQMTLPLKFEAAAGRRPIAGVRRPADRQAHLMPADILVVDDEDDIRELVSGILSDEGHSTRLARNSDEALAAIEARRPQLVLLDIWLQGSRLDGLKLLEIVKQQHGNVPVVMISGHGNIETAVTAIKLGAYDFIEKPFKADRLILVAERALETSRLKREVNELAPAPAPPTG